MGDDDRTAKVSGLLHEAAETHHTVFRISDGVDPDWATWYSNWLTTLSELPHILGGDPVRSQLTAALVDLDRQFTDENPDERWEDYYARSLVDQFGAKTPGAQ